MLTDERIEQILTLLPKKTIGLLGDLFLDRYLDIEASLTEPSLETGLDAYQVVQVRSYPGALGTVLNNLAALGVGRILPISIIGDDGEGHELRQALQKLRGVQPGSILTAPERRTPTYTKPMLMEKGSPPRELNRLDIKNRIPTPSNLEDRIIQLLEVSWKHFDCLIVLDQVSEENCGVVTKRVREALIARCEKDPAKFVLADSRERIHLFRNVSVKPNEVEVRQMAEKESSTWNRNVFCTQGQNGIQLRLASGEEKLIPGFPVTGPIDIVGAGDSCSAGISCAIACGASVEEAAAFGNLVASITVQQIGTTGTATPQQVRDRWNEVKPK